MNILSYKKLIWNDLQLELEFLIKNVKGYCISLKSISSDCDTYPGITSTGDPITVFHNKGYNHAAEKVTIPSGFQNFEYCIAVDDLDIENDDFKFFASGSDGVCITSLHVDGKQLFVGKNDDLTSFVFARPNQGESFVCLSDKMKTPSLTIKNGKVIQSQCKGTIKKYIYFII